MKNLKKSSHFRHYLYLKIREARIEAGLPVENLNQDIIDHKLIGSTIYSLVEEKEYIVEKVNKQWYEGWYLLITLLDSNQLRKRVYWMNLNCKDEQILKGIDEARENFLFIDNDGKYCKELD